MYIPLRGPNRMKLLLDITALIAAFKTKDLKQIFGAFGVVMADIAAIFQSQASGQKMAFAPEDVKKLEFALTELKECHKEFAKMTAKAGVMSFDWMSLLATFINDVLPMILKWLQGQTPAIVAG